MALGAITKVAQGGEVASSPTYVDFLSFLADSTYPAEGTPGFQATVQTAVGDGREVLGVIPQDVGDLVPAYDKVNDKLKIFLRSTGAEASPGDLSATTLNLVVLSK